MKNNKSNPLLERPRANVDSSHIKSIGYDPDQRTLIVEFKRGAIWGYSPITPGTFDELYQAESKGTYFKEKIKDNTTVTATCLQPR